MRGNGENSQMGEGWLKKTQHSPNFNLGIFETQAEWGLDFSKMSEF